MQLTGPAVPLPNYAPDARRRQKRILKSVNIKDAFQEMFVWGSNTSQAHCLGLQQIIGYIISGYVCVKSDVCSMYNISLFG